MNASDRPPHPPALFARRNEWDRLVDFVESPLSKPLLGLVYGRRRQGKTTLLKLLVDGYAGFYWQAQETEPDENLASLSSAYGQWVGSSAPVSFSSWGEAIAVLLSPRHNPTPIVLDEIGRVIGRVTSLPSIIQQHLDPTTNGVDNRCRLVLCGSAFGQMRRLLDGTAPLRGRATLELVVQPFDFRTAARFWGVDGNPRAAFELFAYIGGTPAYPTFAGGETPADGNVDRWVCRRLLDPSSALFREGRIIVAEDDEVGDQNLYWGLLGAVASGRSRWGDIDEALGAKRGSLSHALRTVTDAGWVLRRDDPLRKNRSTYELREPLIRFHRLVIEPNEHRLSMDLDSTRIWIDSAPAVSSLIWGPELERLTFEWCLGFAAASTLGGIPSFVGPTSLARPVDDGKGASIKDLDLAVVEQTSRGGRRLLALGEVKAHATPVGAALLDRLDRAAASLISRPPPGVDTSGTIRRLLVSKSGFTNEMTRVAASRPEVELVDLDRLYHGE